ncbi:MAG: acyl-CoA thioesterase [Chitinophagaceae bacterium]
MESYSLDIQLRWSDLDPNFHLRHSVYYDWGALCRIEFLNKFDLNANNMQQLHIGPILFREECVFKREIRQGDKVKIDLRLVKSKKDYSRWTMQHIITKNDETVSAIVTIDGAWMDTVKRKLTIPPVEVEKAFIEMPRSADFQWAE